MSVITGELLEEVKKLTVRTKQKRSAIKLVKAADGQLAIMCICEHTDTLSDC